MVIKYHKTDLLDRANPVLFAIVSWTAPKKPFGFTRKAFLVSNNGRIYVSRGVDKKEGTTRGRNQLILQAFLQMKLSVAIFCFLEGFVVPLGTVAIIVDFLEIVK